MVDNSLQSYFTQLGLHPEESQLYLHLLGKERQTVQDLANLAGVAKTTAYRRLRRLRQLGLVEEIISDFTTYYRVSNSIQVKLLVNEQLRKAEDLVNQLPIIVQKIDDYLTPSDPTTEVKYFRGIEGVKQMTWNITMGKGDVCGYSHRVFEEVGARFAQDWSQEFTKTGRKARDLYSDEYLVSLKERGYTLKNNPGIWINWQSRYISPKILTIKHQQDIYDDVIAIYNWYEEEIFGIEIHNQQVANLQRQLFELAWLASEKQVGQPKA